MESACGTGNSEGKNLPVPTRLNLKVTAGPCKGQKYDSKSTKVYLLKVGRSKKSQVPFKDGAVSENHAEVAWDGTAWTITDLDSSNGTFVNGEELQRYRPRRLKSEDAITFGVDTVAVVQVTEQTVANVTVEQLLQAFFESKCQALQRDQTEEADAILKRCEEDLAKMLAPPQEVA